MWLRVDNKRVLAATGGQPFDPENPAIIFIHGAGMDRSVWALQTRWFAWRGRSVLAVDLPGHGGSEGPALGSIEAQGEWLLRLMDAAGVSSSALVGHSMGALAALAAAAAGGERVTALALLGVAASMPVHPDLLSASHAGDEIAHDLIVSWGFGQPAHFGANRTPGMWMQGGGKSLLARAPAGHLGIDLEACRVYENAVEAAAAATCPMLVVCGSLDRMTPPEGAKELTKAARDARIITIAEAGHMMMVEKPDETLDALASAL